jgi:hypothetical protein
MFWLKLFANMSKMIITIGFEDGEPDWDQIKDRIEQYSKED